MKRFLVLVGVGTVLYVLAFPPVDGGAVSLLALAAFGTAWIRPTPWGWSLLAAYGAGTILFAAACSWIAEVSGIGLWLVAAVEGLSLPLFGVLFRVSSSNRWRPLPVWIALPAAWISMEFLRARFPLDGFPWLLCGYTLWRVPPLVQSADLAGVYGPGFLLALGAGVIVSWIAVPEGRARVRSAYAGTAVFLLLGLAALVYGLVRPASLEVEPGPVVAAVQGNIPQNVKDDAASADHIFDTYFTATEALFREKAGPRPALVVWPETIFPWPLGEGRTGDRWYKGGYGYEAAVERERRYIRETLCARILGPAQAWFLTGVLALRRNAAGRLEKRNGGFLYDPVGRRRDGYYKTVLVPGGEYLPLVESLPFRERLEEWVVRSAGYLPDLVPGFGVRVMAFRAGDERYRFGVVICFENIYGDYCRRFTAEGAQFLVNLSNEGWFHTSCEFDQMLAMSVFRAVENRRTLFRSTNTGVSCVIGPLGRVPGERARIVKGGRDRDVAGTLVASVPLCSASTLYVAWGDWLGFGVCSCLFLYICALLLKRRTVTRKRNER